MENKTVGNGKVEGSLPVWVETLLIRRFGVIKALTYISTVSNVFSSGGLIADQNSNSEKGGF